MRKLISLFTLTATLLAFSAMGAATGAAAGPIVPRRAGEFVFHMPDGSQKLLTDYKGKTIVLALMYTTCPHCQKTAHVMSEIQTEYASRGVQMLGAAFDQGAEQRVKEFISVLKLNFPVGTSPVVPALEFVKHPVNDPYFVPILVFIDKTGTVRSQYIGDEKFLDKQEVNIRKEIDKMLGGAAAKPAVKPAITSAAQ